ncbi:MAG: molybdopterin molybdotransferase MoeA [Pseudomonadota bacterium]|nr:molybdopterin molybdotransferase MoeA [Pseudomonadota bacterium]
MTDTSPPPLSTPAGDTPADTPVDQVLADLLRLAWPLPPQEQETVSLLQALGRVLAHDIISPISVPAHDNAAMDGYAFAGSQMAPGQPLTLHVIGTALAGQPWTGPVGKGQCLRIMTGATLPDGLDTVVPQEHTQVRGEHVHIPADTVRPGAHRRQRGEDLMAGQPALRQGERLGPAALGLLASLGLTQAPVYRRLRVACLSTGSEILAPGQPPRPGAVYDSNRYSLHGLLTRLGVDVIDLGVIRDDPALLREAFSHAAAQADALITSGGVGAGEADHTQAILQELGEVAFWHIAMRPGRPMAAGRIGTAQGSTLLLGLPGNPVAAMVSFLAFVRPTLLHMMGARDTAAPPPLMARSEHTLRKKPGRTEYQRGIVTQQAEGSLSVRSTGHQGSGVLSSMVQANGLIMLSHEQGDVAAGEQVPVMMFEGLLG